MDACLKQINWDKENKYMVALQAGTIIYLFMVTIQCTKHSNLRASCIIVIDSNSGQRG